MMPVDCSTYFTYVFSSTRVCPKFISRAPKQWCWGYTHYLGSYLTNQTDAVLGIGSYEMLKEMAILVGAENAYIERRFAGNVGTQFPCWLVKKGDYLVILFWSWNTNNIFALYAQIIATFLLCLLLLHFSFALRTAHYIGNFLCACINLLYLYLQWQLLMLLLFLIVTYLAMPDSQATADSLWEQINNILEDSPARNTRCQTAATARGSQCSIVAETQIESQLLSPKTQYSVLAETKDPMVDI